jgi:glycosyltransferase involved in cell wall biosynthesis
VLVDGQTGLVVPVDNRAALAAAAARLIENKDLCTAMGAAARARCQQLFTIDTVTGVWMSVLEPLLNGHWRPRAGSDR